MTTALDGDEGSAARPGRSLPPGKTRYPLYSRLGGPQGRSGQVRKISPPPGFDTRTVQPVTSRFIAVCYVEIIVRIKARVHFVNRSLVSTNTKVICTLRAF